MKIKYSLSIESALSLHPIREKQIELDTDKEFGDDFLSISKDEQEKMIESWLKNAKDEFLFNSIDVRHRRVYT